MDSMKASLRLMRSSRSISYWDLGAAGMFDGIFWFLLVLGVSRRLRGSRVPARESRFLAARGLSTRFRSSVRCREAARGDGGLCGLLISSWRACSHGVRSTVFSARSRRAGRLGSEERIVSVRRRFGAVYTSKSSGVLAGPLSLAPASRATSPLKLEDLVLRIMKALGRSRGRHTQSGRTRTRLVRSRPPFHTQVI